MWRASDFFGLEIDKKTRKREYIAARQMFIDYMRKNSWLSLTEIGRLLGAKHHASIIHASKSVQDIFDTPIINKAWIALYKEFCDYMDSFEQPTTFSKENLINQVPFL